MTQLVIEKWITFHVNRDDKFDVAIFSGELAPGMRCYKLRIPVPAELVSQETVIAEVGRDEQGGNVGGRNKKQYGAQSQKRIGVINGRQKTT